MVIVDTTDGPDSADLADVRGIENPGALVRLELILAGTKDHHMAVCHTHGHLGEIVQSAHAVDTLRNLDCLEKLERELVVDEDASIARTDEQFVNGDDRAI